MRRLLTLLAFLLFVFLVVGCSGKGTPITIDQNYNDSQSNNAAKYYALPVGVSEFDEFGSPKAGYGALGIFEIHVDTESLKGEMISLRNSSLTDTLEVVDITNFLTLAPCTDCAQLIGIELDADSHVVLQIGIKHPFPAGNPLMPITGRNRADLHVFNIEGLVVSSTTTSTSFPGTGESISDFMLLNADGYSNYLDPSLDEIFTTAATMHPYKLHFDDYSAGNFNAGNPMGFASVTDPPPSGNLVMAMGCDFNVQDYVFNPTSEDISFIYAVGCTYAVSSASKAQRFNPEYRVPQHLKKAASEIKVRVINNDLAAGDTLSEATIEIDVVDVSHGVAVGSALDEMLADSSVDSITLEIPGVLSGTENVALTNIGGSGHSDSDPLIYSHTFQNEAGAGEGTYSGLVKVKDTYTPGLNTSPLLGGRDGIKRVDPTENPLLGIFSIDEFAAYQIFSIDVTLVNELPIAILAPDPANVSQNHTVNFNGTASYDPDGTITLYEFDFEWDSNPAHFSADESNTTGTAVSDPYTILGTYTAGLRVQDNLGSFAYDSVQVNVILSNCPIAPYGGNTFAGNFTSHHHNHYDENGWALFSDPKIDADMMSDGRAVCVHSDQGSYEGEMRLFNLVTNSPYTAIGPDWPGYRVISIDVDSSDLIIFVGSSLPHRDNDEYPLDVRIAAANSNFRVVNPTTGPSSEQIINVGTPINAVEIDGYDDVWVLDTNKVMHRYVKSSGYTEDTSRQFDLDTVTSNALTGLVHDFVINFYNEAFFILEDTPNGQCNVWRIECDGTYNSNINGNPNPLVDVFFTDTVDVADIGIDNLDSAGNHLVGDQDSQIVCVSGSVPGSWYTQITRINTNMVCFLPKVNQAPTPYGLSNVFFDQKNLNTNGDGCRLYGFERDFWSDAWTAAWVPASDWQ